MGNSIKRKRVDGLCGPKETVQSNQIMKLIWFVAVSLVLWLMKRKFVFLELVGYARCRGKGLRQREKTNKLSLIHEQRAAQQTTLFFSFFNYLPLGLPAFLFCFFKEETSNPTQFIFSLNSQRKKRWVGWLIKERNESSPFLSLYCGLWAGTAPLAASAFHSIQFKLNSISASLLFFFD